jgi:CheY-like chemotaxis protein
VVSAAEALGRREVRDMSIRVLVVDDDADFRSMITLTLEPENDMTVIGEAGDGETGWLSH